MTIKLRRVVGCMTGTSIDGIDAALVEIDGTGLSIKPRFVRGHSSDLGSICEPLRKLADQHPMTAADIAAAMHASSLLHVKVIRELLNGEKCDLIAVHGQTVFHKPPLSWQLMQPAPIARELNTPVVFDMRAMDLAAGGQGAPITPIADWILFRHLHEPMHPRRLAIANLGGFCNITVLPYPETTYLHSPGSTIHATEVAVEVNDEGEVLSSTSTSETHHDAVIAPKPESERDLSSEAAEIGGGDVCACNQLLDMIARKLMGIPFDNAGERALAGHIHNESLVDLEGLLRSQRGQRRSLGTGDETGEWLSRWRAHVAPDDLAATACEAIAQVIAEYTQGCRRILLAGGGARNAALAQAITSCATAIVEPINAHGLPAGYREAACFAILGALCQDRTPITLPQVTGVASPAPISGAWVLP